MLITIPLDELIIFLLHLNPDVKEVMIKESIDDWNLVITERENMLGYDLNTEKTVYMTKEWGQKLEEYNNKKNKKIIGTNVLPVRYLE